MPPCASKAMRHSERSCLNENQPLGAKRSFGKRPDAALKSVTAASLLGIANAGRRFRDLPGDQVRDRSVRSVTERLQCCFVCGDKPVDVFRRQRRVLKDPIDRHHDVPANLPSASAARCC